MLNYNQQILIVGIPEESILHVKNVTNTKKIAMFSSCSQTGHSYEDNVTYIDGKLKDRQQSSGTVSVFL